MKRSFLTKFLGMAVWLCAISFAFSLQSCGNPDEPSVIPQEPSINPDELLKKEIVGTWISENAFENGEYSIISELRIGYNGKMVVKQTTATYSNHTLIGMQSTEFPSVEYEITDGMLDCSEFGKYEIVPTGNTLTLISIKDNTKRLWPKLVVSNNGVTKEFCPDWLKYTRQ